MGAPDAAPQQLRDNWSLLDASEASTAAMLLDAGQEHLFAAWPALGERDDDKKRLLAQVCLSFRGLAASAFEPDQSSWALLVPLRTRVRSPHCSSLWGRHSAKSCTCVCLSHACVRLTGCGVRQGTVRHRRLVVVCDPRSWLVGRLQERGEPV
jgi:hypothetical protein